MDNSYWTGVEDAVRADTMMIVVLLLLVFLATAAVTTAHVLDFITNLYRRFLFFLWLAVHLSSPLTLIYWNTFVSANW